MKSNTSVVMDSNELLEGEMQGRWADARDSLFFFASLAVVIAYVVAGVASDVVAKYLETTRGRTNKGRFLLEKVRTT